MAVKVTKPEINVREKLIELENPKPWVPPSFRADLNSVQTVPTGSWEIYEADTVYWDTHGTYDADTFTYVVPISGIYVFMATQWWASKPEGRTISRININGSGLAYHYELSDAGGSWTHHSMHSCNAGDKVKIEINQASGSSQQMDPSDLNNGFSGFMVSGQGWGTR